MAAPAVSNPAVSLRVPVGSGIAHNMRDNITDADANDFMLWSATGFPAGTGLSMNSLTGVITGVPTAADIAALPFNVTVVVSDLNSNSFQTTVTLVGVTAPDPGPGGGGAWEIEPDFPGPPTLVNPDKYVGTGALTVQFKAAFSKVGPGNVYTVPANPGGDIFIDMRTDAVSMGYPLSIPDCRSVIVVAPWIVIVSQAGNGKFELPNKNFPIGQLNGNTAFDNARAPIHGWNIHERVAQGFVFESKATDVTFLEGPLFDAGGRQTDMIVMPSSSQLPSYSHANRKFIGTNVRLLDFEGQAFHKDYDDGLHADAFQVQTNTSGDLVEKWFQNWYQRSGQQGFVDTGSPKGPNRIASFVRWQHVQTDAFKTNEINLTDYANPGEKAGAPPISLKMLINDDWRIKDCWYAGKNKLLTLKKETPTKHIVAIGDNPSNTRIEHAEAHAGIRPNDPAPANLVGGTAYTSPWVYTY